MPVSGNPFGVIRRALAKTVRDRREVLVAVGVTVKELITDQFAFGLDPYGKPQPPAKHRFTGLVSEKLPNAIKVKPDANGVVGMGELKSSGTSRKRKAKGKKPSAPRARRQWLNAHQEGHTWPARTTEGQRRFYDSRGKRVHASRFKALTDNATRRVSLGAREAYWQETKNRARLKGRVVNVRTWSARERVLPVRRIYPTPTLGARWGGRIKSTVGATVSTQFSRNVEAG